MVSDLSVFFARCSNMVSNHSVFFCCTAQTWYLTFPCFFALFKHCTRLPVQRLGFWNQGPAIVFHSIGSAQANLHYDRLTISKTIRATTLYVLRRDHGQIGPGASAIRHRRHAKETSLLTRTNPQQGSKQHLPRNSRTQSQKRRIVAPYPLDYAG